jgi:hypothetical protein
MDKLDIQATVTGLEQISNVVNPNGFDSLKKGREQAIIDQLKAIKTNLDTSFYKIKTRESLLTGFIIEVSKN